MALNSLSPPSSINLRFSSTYIHSYPVTSNSKYAPSSSSFYSSSLSLSQSIHSVPKIRNPDFKGSRRVKCISKEYKLKVMISGAPASGKGTQCDLIVQKYDLVHISTGDLLRAEVASATDIGKKATEYMNSGQLVPDEIVTDMLISRLSKQDVTEKGWLLDGYPRTSSQAHSLEKMNIKPDIFVLLDVPDDILIERCVGRRMDPVTRKIYHVKYFPPETEEISKRLIIRSDDTLEKVKSRLETYKRNTEAILSTYKDLLHKVDGNRCKDAVFYDIDSLLQKVLATVAKSRSLRSSNGDLSVGIRTAGTLDQGKWRGIPTRLNNIPHSREIRNYFYNDVLQATLKAIEDKRIRLKVEINIPELNPEMDVYRIGTLMELVRTLALAFADDGKRVKVCVQGSMGEGALAGMPLQLAGSRKILEYMDWGEYGAKEDFIKIGSIGGREVEEQDDIFILIAPQNAVGNCIIDDLQDMTTAAGIRPVILINPRLKDLPASSGIMQTMGREKRLEYAASFENCYFFRLLYYAGTQYPIMGALRMSSPDCYELFRRIDEPSLKKEKYVLIATFPKKPTGDEINDAFDGKTRSKATSGFWGFLSSILPA